MRRFLCFLTAAAIVISLCGTLSFASSGITYYVDSSLGDDTNTGLSPDAAWKTLSKASSVTYSAGDKLLFKAGGVYTGAFTARGSGTAENPILLSAYGDTAEDGLPLFSTSVDEALITLHNVSGWTVESLELTAPEGKGFMITANGCIMSDITVRSCILHNIWNHQTETYNGSHMPVFIAANGQDTRIEGLTLSGLSIYDCAYGIHMGGNTAEWSPQIYVSPEVSYSQDMIFEDISMNNILYDGMAICSVNNLIIRNCSLIGTSLNTDYYTAPLWMHHANNVIVESCEVAGATNYLDGMTVDFDGWTTNSTYQYIYSHDNIRFMQNCVYDNTTKNANCTVRYCLSVNDNKEPNNIALCNSASYTDDDNAHYMDNLRFYNNTIINGSEFKLFHLRNSVIANNIFYGDLSERLILHRSWRNDDTGKKYLARFTGTMQDNCLYGCCVPMGFGVQLVKNPLFAGTDFSDSSSFMLSANSPLIGAGCQAEDDMGARDFYGNPLTATHNIGCYEGEGIDDGQQLTLADRFDTLLCNVLGRLGGLLVLLGNLV